MKKNHAILIMGRLASNVKYIHQCASATSKLCTIYNNIREALFIANAIPNLHQLGEGHMVVVFDKNVGHQLQIFIFVVNKIITDIIRLMRTYSIVLVKYLIRILKYKLLTQNKHNHLTPNIYFNHAFNYQN